MNTYPYLDPWMQCLIQLTPPRGLVHIGAGSSGGQYPYAAIPNLLIFEADTQHHARLQAQLQDHPNCQVLQTVVAEQSGTADFYALSQSNESGLCPATALQTLWPNIKTLRAETLSCSPLQALLAQVPGGPEVYNWVVIDCLPAHQIITGAGELINHWDVLTLRAFKDNADADTQSMCLPALRQQLAAFGLEFVSFEEENHPQMVHALFVRNPAQQVAKDKAAITALKAQHASLAQEKAKLIADNAELTMARDQFAIQKDAEAKAKADAITQRDALAKEKAALTAARDEEANLAAERQTALTALQARHDSLVQERAKLIADSVELTRARDQLSNQKDVEAKAKAELAAARDQQAKLATERQTALAALQTQHESQAQEKAKLLADIAELERTRDQLGIEKDAEAKAKVEAISQRDAEARAKAGVLAERDKLAKDKIDLTATLDEQAKLAAERQAALAIIQQDISNKQQCLQKLEADNQDYAARQHLLQEELIKAEAQIDLIKDLLLREPGL